MKIMWIFWGRGYPRAKNVDGMVTAGASMWPILNSASEEKQSSIRIVGYTKAIYANQRKKGKKKETRNPSTPQASATTR